MPETELPTLCSACVNDVEPGALRCRHCGARFRGAGAQPQLRLVPVASMLGSGVTVDVRVEEVRLED